jgi:hypothetical protein
LERLINTGAEIDLKPLLPEEERLVPMVAAFQDLGIQTLAPIRDHLGGRVTYEELRLVRMHLRQQRTLDE